MSENTHDESIVVRVSNGGHRYEFLNSEGEYHNHGDDPAVIQFIEDPLEMGFDGHIEDIGMFANASNSTMYYYKNGKLHRDGDEPAVIVNASLNHFFRRKELKWYKDGVLHRDGDKPAHIVFKVNENSNALLPDVEVYKDGEQITDIDELVNYIQCDLLYYKNGNLHRGGGNPAIITSLPLLWNTISNSRHKWYNGMDLIHNHYAHGIYVSSGNIRKKISFWHDGIQVNEKGEVIVTNENGDVAYMNKSVLDSALDEAYEELSKKEHDTHKENKSFFSKIVNFFKND